MELKKKKIIPTYPSKWVLVNYTKSTNTPTQCLSLKFRDIEECFELSDWSFRSANNTSNQRVIFLFLKISWNQWILWSFFICSTKISWNQKTRSLKSPIFHKDFLKVKLGIENFVKSFFVVQKKCHAIKIQEVYSRLFVRKILWKKSCNLGAKRLKKCPGVCKKLCVNLKLGVFY